MAGLRVCLSFVTIGMFWCVVFCYDRPPAGQSRFISRSQHLGPNCPQQVHISVVGNDRMRISRITENQTPAIVKYGTSPGIYEFPANGTTSSCHFVMYLSGQIHEVVIGPLKPNTIYYYLCGQDLYPEFNLKTPPAQFPINFAVVVNVLDISATSNDIQNTSMTL